METNYKKPKTCEVITDLEKAKNFISHEEYEPAAGRSYTNKFLIQLLTECCWQFLKALGKQENKIRQLEADIDRNVVISNETFAAIPAAFAEIEAKLKTVVEALRPFADCINEKNQMQDILQLSHKDFTKAAETIKEIQSLKGWTDKLNTIKENL